MSSVIAKGKRMIAVLLSVLAVAPSIWGQALRVREVRTRLDPALREVIGKRRLDKGDLERVRKAFFPGETGEETWDKKSAIDRFTESIRQPDFGLTLDKKGFEVLHRQPPQFDAAVALKTSGLFVDSVSSVIRRMSILTEIGPVESKKLNHSQLREYLKDTAKVPDYAEVTESFDPALRAEVVTFKKPTTLLRLYGGGSQATGRYFFCCLWPPEGATGQTPEGGKITRFWSDASGLATPPENLVNHLVVATILAGTTAIIGTVADNFLDAGGHFRPGGNTQIFIPEVKTFRFEEYPVAGGRGEVTQIEIQSEDRILRFSK